MSQRFPQRYQSRVVSQHRISESAYELVIERHGLEFQAGREIMIHGDAPEEDRQYSIASGEQDEHLHLIYRLIPEGLMTPKLVKKVAGDPIEFTGPIGSFLIRDFLAPLVFFATGTGVAPAISFIKSHPGLDLTLVHGVRETGDLFYRDVFDPAKYVPCISKEQGTDGYEGRVTSYFVSRTWPLDAHYYLCGANDMILEMRRHLLEAGVADAQIYSEAYYFW
jgi:ferredoxin/flavodoxin---NADP+ reductase